MPMKFTKMHGLGNDFMVINAINQTVKLSPKDIQYLSRRDIGVGFDQCLLVEKSQKADIDFIYRIYNADGQEVGQCGNGARCLARFIAYYGLSNKKHLNLATKTTQLQVTLNEDSTVTVNMGIPQWHPAAIPLQMPQENEKYWLSLPNQQSVSIHAVSLGNPHAVTVIDKLMSTDDIKHLGQQISEHVLFPEQCNAGFMQILNSDTIKLRVYERGCGETKACGSGAVAAAAVGKRFYHMADRITVKLPGGDLIILWEALNQPIYLTGPADFVYEGQLL